MIKVNAAVDRRIVTTANVLLLVLAEFRATQNFANAVIVHYAVIVHAVARSAVKVGSARTAEGA